METTNTVHRENYFPLTLQTGSLFAFSSNTNQMDVNTVIKLNFLGCCCSASLAQMGESKNTDAVSQETHEEEMDRLKLEIQQCKDFIQTQQLLLQVRLDLS